MHSIRKVAVLVVFALTALIVAGVADAGTVPLVPNGVVNVKALPTAPSSSTFSPTNEFKADQDPRRRTTPPAGSSASTAASHRCRRRLRTALRERMARSARAGPVSTTSTSARRTTGTSSASNRRTRASAPGAASSSSRSTTCSRSTTPRALAYAGPVDLNSFFGLAAQVDRTQNPAVDGPFLSDPKCYYDTDTQRWFLTELQEDATGVRAHTLIAVSTSSDPTATWDLFSIDATDDGQNGTPSHPNCPCFGDQPLIGADANGFYITTNEFGDTEGFNGSQVYAMSKKALEGGFTPVVVQFDNLSLAEGQAYSIQPATSPSAGDYDTSNSGTEYFLSALDFNATLDNRIAAWAITNTSSLATGSPSVTLQSVLVKSENYGQPPTATQKDGPHPVRRGSGRASCTAARPTTDRDAEHERRSDEPGRLRGRRAVRRREHRRRGRAASTLAGVESFKVRPNAKTHGHDERAHGRRRGTTPRPATTCSSRRSASRRAASRP